MRVEPREPHEALREEITLDAREILDGLDPDDRALVTLEALDFSDLEIAERLGTSVRRLRRQRACLHSKARKRFS